MINIKQYKVWPLQWLLASIIFLVPCCIFAFPVHTPHWTAVEKTFLANSGRQHTYSNEYIAAIEVRNSYELGKLMTLRFIEWAQHNPRGVIGFTNTGTMSEFFVKFLNYYKNNWHKPEVQTELQNFGINSKTFPKTSDLKLVQIEELYPVSDKSYKKLSNYTKRHYSKLLQIKPENILLMDIAQRGILAEKGLNVVFMNGKVDLSITQHQANSQLEIWQQLAIKELNDFCVEYENKIRAWGGIGFLTAGMGYTGHLCFNEPGGRADSKTHIVKLDHRTAALVAKDFSDIDFARGKVAITIGIGTMTINPDATVLVIASGESKSEAVRNAIEGKSTVRYPASLLQKFPNSRFYITYGAAKLLSDRRTDDIRFKSKRGWTQKNIEEVILEVALAEKKPILSLKVADLNRHMRGKMLLANPPKPLTSMLNEVHNNVVKKIENGLKISNTNKSQKILHTAPHHGDIVLGYYSLFDGLSYKNKNYIAYFTSGFNSVTDKYLLTTLNRASDWWLDKERDVLFNKPYEKLINAFKTYFLKQDFEEMSMLETTMLMRHLISIYNIKNLDELKHTIRWLKDDYFPSKQLGDLDVADIRAIKGMMRESESDRLWSLKNIPLQNIVHLRSKFYSGREFMRTPRYESDIIPFINLYNKVLPDIITVVDDPQSDPAMTNYRVLQIIAQGLRSNASAYNPNLKILGYRNIWFRYSVFEANLFIPVPEHKLALQRKAFYSCFNTQKAALFPSPFYEGDFPTVSIAIQRDQFAELKILLGEDYFANSNIPELRTASGFVFLMQMEMHYLFRRAEDLQQYVEIEDEYIAHKN